MTGQEQYKKISDEELIKSLRGGETEVCEYLLNKYKPLVRRQARTMYLIGGENDDLIQEGMIGLLKAVQSYRPEGEGTFASFAELCITRQMYAAVQASNRMKHAPLNQYVSLDEKPHLLTEQTPEELMIDQENLKSRYEQIERRLTPLEKKVLELYLDGKTYGEIAVRIGKNEKAVDNSIQRLKKKLDKDENKC